MSENFFNSSQGFDSTRLDLITEPENNQEFKFETQNIFRKKTQFQGNSIKKELWRDNLINIWAFSGGYDCKTTHAWF